MTHTPPPPPPSPHDPWHDASWDLEVVPPSWWRRQWRVKVVRRQVGIWVARNYSLFHKTIATGRTRAEALRAAERWCDEYDWTEKKNIGPDTVTYERDDRRKPPANYPSPPPRQSDPSLIGYIEQANKRGPK